jgi:DNA-binding NarL/FixJ family response regulator
VAPSYAWSCRMTDPITVVIADDHEMVRNGLRTFLSLQNDIEVVGEARDGRECVAVVERTGPDVVLLDLLMPVMDGLATITALRHAGNPARVLVVTSVTESTRLAAAVRAGAAGCVYKDIDPPALANAIRSVHSGHVILPPAVATALLAGPGDNQLANLTPRELEVLAAVVAGQSNREIARSLTLAEKTVKTHVSSILTKLGLADRTQAALYAVRHGLTDPG